MNRRFSRSTLAALTAVAFLASACQTVNPYTREGETSKATKGAILGGLAGAVLGAATGDDSADRRKRALIGLGVGALAGGAVGAYMDRQEARLREQLAGTGVSVTRVGDNLVLNMPGNITFATNSSDINSDFYPVLGSVATVLNEFDKTVIEVAGHTDSTGTLEYNQQLSERRAMSVGNYLLGQGIRQQRILTRGFGPNKPMASNATPEGRQLNRRVELTLIPLTE